MKYTYRYNEQDRLELLCISFSGMVRTKGETVHTPDFFFPFLRSSPYVWLGFFFLSEIF